MKRPRPARASLVPVVSDHAVLRYLQRVKGVDVEALRAEILGEGRAAVIAKCQNCKLSIGGGAKLVVQERVVVTVLAHEGDTR